LADIPAAEAVSSSSALGPAVQMALAMLVILGVILLAFWMLKRYGPRLGLRGPNKPYNLRFEGQLALGPKKSVMVVRFLNKLLVLGVTEHSINLLTEVDQTHDDQEDFARALDKAGAAADGGPDPDSGSPVSGGPDRA
jgi:flagellar protein FliO/FliZ